ncbi:MAG: DMT family transporter, partial [Saprospiraceae bacterium]|nr:DMT family transporter [Saprospiraceae bacterium]
MLRAILFMIAGALCFTLLNTLVRSVSYLSTFQLVFFRSIGSVLCCTVFLLSQKISFLGNQPKWLFLRGVVGLISMALFFKAIQMMPLGSAVALRYLSPFFAAFMAVIFLGEKMRGGQWIFFCTAFIGVLLVKGFDPRISTI